MRQHAKKLMTIKFILPIGFLLLFFLLIFGVIFSLLLIISSDNGDESGGGVGIDGSAQVNEEIERLRPLFEKYAKLHGIPEKVDLLMAIAMQESGGRHLDVMQSSESIGLPPNSIIRPERSINVGVEYFSEMLKQANGDTKLALQAYNFGGGFINYAMNNGGKYTLKTAKAFSSMQSEKLGWESYGDTSYVSNVMRYMTGINTNPNFNGEWAYPVKNPVITSEFGMRSDPFTGEKTMHSGLDFDCDRSDSIYSVGDGTVTQAVNFHLSYGNYVMVKHNANNYSLYAHMSSLSVNKGDQVKVGQQVGVCGTTGSSTGTHLHLEYHKNDKKKNPVLKLNNEGESNE
ncbi:MAG TPA: lysozyme family protein [Candidatus Dormibacteraeota bacterium]|nr:lysozyme family protein [Candidatus Dormibacteraeota bacterium]